VSTPILATKLYVPQPQPGGVLRPRLIERLNEDLHRKLTLISAPAGFGKTTLLSEWLAGNERPAAWLSLEAGESDVTRFLAYLLAALQKIEAHIGEGVLRALQSPQHPPAESILTTLLNEIATVEENFVLVLDDYHVVDARAVDDALAFLLEHLPPQAHLVIATREDPRLPLARLRARGQLTELRAADLRFTPSEAAEFFSGVMGLDLSAESIAALDSRTEGWIAGLQLAAISMRAHKDAAGFIESFTGSHRFVLDYLVEEVLGQQTESVQAFLLCTSILDRLCGPLCDAVVPDRSATGQATLEYLERANLFLVPLDGERRWYRYHHLFAELLRQRLYQNGDLGVAALHVRASEWFEGQGLEAEAIHHALVAEDFERAASLIELSWRAMDRSLQFATWLGWVEALPDEIVRARPVLGVAYAWALLDTGELEAGESRLRDAEWWLETTAGPSGRPEVPAADMVVVDEEEFRSLPVTIASARAYRAQALGDVSGTMEHARRALDLLPEDDHLGRAIPGALLGLAYWESGDLEAAYRTIVDALMAFQMTGNIVAAISGTYGLAEIRMDQGRLREAARTYQEALRLTVEHGEPTLRGTADLYLGLSGLHLEWGDLEAAREYLLKSEELSVHAALPDWPYRCYVAKARIEEAQGKLHDAFDLLDEAERLYYRTPVPDVRPVTALKARVWVKQGRLTEARGWARERGLSVQDDLSYLREFEHIVLARLLMAEHKTSQEAGSIPETMRLLERLLEAAEAGGRMGRVIEILILQALAHQMQGDTSASLEPLQRSLTLAEPEGYVRIFVDEGVPMAGLLFEVAARGTMPDYTAMLLAAFEAEGREGKDTSDPPPAQSLVEPLSQREMEVLRLIAQGLSNREIGERLFLALDTVKGHNRRIFGKLSVQRRTEAVAKARSLDILPRQD
jgi:LuxR family transcriptional regulator, maltose regulon positive regulatory protein